MAIRFLILMIMMAMAESLEEFVYTGTYVMLDKPDSPMDDEKNVFMPFSFDSSLFYHPSKLVERAKVQCEGNPEFLKFWSGDIPCEYELAKIALASVLEKPTYKSKINRPRIENSISQVNSMLFSSKDSMFGRGNVGLNLSMKGKPCLNFLNLFKVNTNKGIFNSNR